MKHSQTCVSIIVLQSCVSAGYLLGMLQHLLHIHQPPPDTDEEVDSERSDSDNDDPPSWVQRDPDPPSWTVPRPPWVLVTTGTDQRAGFGCPQGTEVQSFSRAFNQTTPSDCMNISILALKAATDLKQAPG